MSSRLDHLVYAVPDLDAACDELATRFGVRPSTGGRHPGRGTRNALLALSSDTYLEVIGPDPEQEHPAAGRPFGIDRLAAPRLLTWAVKATSLEERVAAARRRGFDPGEVRGMSRRTPDGAVLEWHLTVAPTAWGDGLVPFLIDWGAPPSPAGSAAAGCALRELRAEHPDPDSLRPALAALDVELAVGRAAEARLVAVLETPNGRQELR